MTVFFSAHIPGYGGLLKTMTKENGFFELTSAIILFMIAIYGVYFCKQNYKKLSKIALIIIGGFAFVAFFGAMEELSWGQHFFHFESSEYFIENNLQKETNLHNLVSPELFSSIIFSLIYGLFVFIPPLVILLEPLIKILSRIKPWTATHSMTLIILFSSSFQAFFYGNFGVWSDTITLIAGMILFGIVLRFTKTESIIKWQYSLIWITIGIFMISYKIFRYKNMQYEIREAFVGLALLYYYIFLTRKYLVQTSNIKNISQSQ